MATARVGLGYGQEYLKYSTAAIPASTSYMCPIRGGMILCLSSASKRPLAWPSRERLLKAPIARCSNAMTRGQSVQHEHAYGDYHYLGINYEL